jgi:TonB family protein
MQQEQLDEFFIRIQRVGNKVERQRAILWTLIVHLSLLIVILLTQFGGDIPEKQEQAMLVDFETEEFNVEEEIAREELERMEMIKNIVAQELSKELRNIPVNQSKKESTDDISTEKYMEELAQEYDFSERFEESVEALEKGDIAVQEETQMQEEKSVQEQDYTGPTTITYELEKRRHRYLHVPVYMCERSGRVVLDIVVNRDGHVIGASVNTSQTEVQDPCLHHAAIEAAKRSQFNIDFNAVARQAGTISYLFMPQ